ncbi:hypothetical protein F5B20DRAFT_589413 [Whalleya microplaca]|nr:hypothetical protein F5B20DRAFT_589413 [Whalleya microplaca]
MKALTLLLPLLPLLTAPLAATTTTPSALAPRAAATALADCTDVHLVRYSELHATCSTATSDAPVTSVLDLDTCFGNDAGTVTYAPNGRFSEGCNTIWLETDNGDNGGNGVYLVGNGTTETDVQGSMGAMTLGAMCLTGVIEKLPNDPNTIDADKALHKSKLQLGPDVIQVKDGKLACHS